MEPAEQDRKCANQFKTIGRHQALSIQRVSMSRQGRCPPFGFQLAFWCRLLLIGGDDMKMPYIKFYVRDWMMSMDLRRCSYAARGLWIEMMCLMSMDRYGYLEHNGKTIQEDELESLTIGLSTRDKGRVNPLLKELEEQGVFSRDENKCIYSRRMVSDYGKKQEFIEYGKHGGNPKLKKRVQKEDKKDQNPEPRTQNPEPTRGLTQGVNPLDIERVALTDFDVFWSLYPRKVGKKVAKESFQKKGCSAIMAKIELAIGDQSKSEDWQRDNGRYIPHPATWLNQERWDDEGTVAPKRKSLFDKPETKGELL